MSARHPRVLFAGDGKVLEQGLQAIAKADLTEWHQRRRQHQQAGAGRQFDIQGDWSTRLPSGATARVGRTV